MGEEGAQTRVKLAELGFFFFDDDDEAVVKGRGRVVTSLDMDIFFVNSSEISFLILNKPSPC